VRISFLHSDLNPFVNQVVKKQLAATGNKIIITVLLRKCLQQVKYWLRLLNSRNLEQFVIKDAHKRKQWRILTTTASFNSSNMSLHTQAIRIFTRASASEIHTIE